MNTQLKLAEPASKPEILPVSKPEIQLAPMMTLRKATPAESNHVLELLGGAVSWLRKDKKTDQWASDEEGRKKRIMKGIRSGHTWIAWDGTTPVATITVDTVAPEIWIERDLSAAGESRHRKSHKPGRQKTRALYVHRLIVNRDSQYKGQRIGAELLDWAATKAAEKHLEHVRVDVWTTNTELHDYYGRQRFEKLGIFEELAPNYAACALLQRPAEKLSTPRITVEHRRLRDLISRFRPKHQVSAVEKEKNWPANGFYSFIHKIVPWATGK